MTTRKVEMWFDTLCPWAWMTSRWLVEVAKVRDISVQWNVMSLFYLNESRTHISAEYLTNAKKALAPLRIIVTAENLYGNRVAGDLYTAFGEEIHLNKMKFSPQLNSKVLSRFSFSNELLECADDTSLDELILASHKNAMSLVGEDVGTPIVSIEGISFFGPVISPAPKGEEAGKLFDGAYAVASYPGFFEMKRTRTVGPIFE